MLLLQYELSILKNHVITCLMCDYVIQNIFVKIYSLSLINSVHAKYMQKYIFSPHSHY